MTQPPKETIPLRDDELEALYLADFKVLYHEECAQALGDGMRRNIEGLGIAIELTQTSNLDTAIAELMH